MIADVHKARRRIGVFVIFFMIGFALAEWLFG